MPKARVRRPKTLKARVRPPAGFVRPSDQPAAEPVHPFDQTKQIDQAGQQPPDHIDVRFRIHVTPEMVVQQSQGTTQPIETVQSSDEDKH